MSILVSFILIRNFLLAYYPVYARDTSLSLYLETLCLLLVHSLTFCSRSSVFKWCSSLLGKTFFRDWIALNKVVSSPSYVHIWFLVNHVTYVYDVIMKTIYRHIKWHGSRFVKHL